MWIFQEYKFFLIIVILSLSWLAIYLLNNQNAFYFNKYISETKENFSRIKSIWWLDSNLNNVFFIANTELKWLPSGKLFWRKFDKSEMYITDQFDVNTWAFYDNDQSEWTFWLALALITDLHSDWIQNKEKVIDLGPRENYWNFDKDWYLIFILDSKKAVEKAIDAYVPNWEIVKMTNITTWVTKENWLMIKFF